jgi:AraC family transcriptional regulator of arabinose operon
MKEVSTSYLRDYGRRIIAGVSKANAGFRRLRPRGMDDWFLQYTIGGGGRWTFRGGEIRPIAGDVVLMRPKTPQDLMADEPGQYWKVATVFFQPRPHWLELMRWREVSPGLAFLRPGPAAAREIKRCLLRAARRCWRGRQPREAFAFAAVEEALIWCKSECPREEAAGMDTRVVRALDFIDQTLHRPIGIDEVASAAGMSRTHLFSLFKRDVGKTPLEYLESKRIERAKLLLRDPGTTIAQVAAAVGYGHAFYFTTRFRKSEGMSPSAFRNTRV